MYFGTYKPPKSPSVRDRFFSSVTDSNPLDRSVFLARREDADATEVLNEIGTTDRAIGDATAETMVTTPGPIPNVMYDLEETTIIDTLIQSEVPTPTVSTLTTMITEEIHTEPAIDSHATSLTILTIASIILLLSCFAVACIWVKSRRRISSSSDLGCDPDCDGARQPLIKTGNFLESTSKTSTSGRK